jgi:hypothetical protein
VRETAAAFGSIAIYDGAGASAHFASAAGHSAAAHAYAAIGGGAVVGAAAIGATRGATAEEKERERNKRDGGSGGSSGPGASTSYGSSRGGDGGAFSVTVVNNAPLMISNETNRQAGRTVARALNYANRSSFNQRMMRG